MTDDELREIVVGLRAVGGDHVDVEAKAALQGLPRRIWETLSAFANTPGGGVLVLGLDERQGFKAVGIGDAKKIQQDVASICDQMEPPLRPQIRVHAFEGHTVVVCEVPEVDRAQKPCSYRGAGHLNGSFIRVADGDRKLTSYEVRLMLSSRGQPRDDEEPVTDASEDDLDRGRVEPFLKRLRGQARNLRDRDDREVLACSGSSSAALTASSHRSPAFLRWVIVRRSSFPRSVPHSPCTQASASACPGRTRSASSTTEGLRDRSPRSSRNHCSTSANTCPSEPSFVARVVRTSGSTLKPPFAKRS